MDDIITNGYTQWGAMGVLVVFMTTAIKKLWSYLGTVNQNHKDERKEWQDETNKMADKVLAVVEKNSSVISELSTQIYGLEK